MKRLSAALGICLICGCTPSEPSTQSAQERPDATDFTLSPGFDKNELCADIRPQDDFWQWVKGRGLDTSHAVNLAMQDFS